MKHINKIYILLFMLASFSMFSCEDEETDDVSFITNYPVFELEGDAIISIVAGGSYSEPGVVATEDGQELEVTVLGTVNATTPGQYTVTYSATNSDGFDGTAQRLVIVTSEDVSGVDLSGAYVRGTTTTTYTKQASGYYTSNNLWGDTNGVAGAFIHTGGDQILVPIQNSRFGRYEGSGTITVDGLSMSFTLLDPPNTGVTLNRVLQKQ
ncbi:DUF5011 domain-containing protein [Fulvivirga ligni]|uniref:DUF5011 domain-containing protein n=1 Tax=Fulvivirga ligni TaxID=2904246 RepID=UPI001F480D79|nr:DUF5011 domain-containing protein [Fulvivirga ligni]UII20182.1 DUF5011 domain-containing protein [Fulvivirga ligni]